MSLTVGELMATVAIDDSEARAGLNRTESAVRSTGDAIASDAEQSGQRAGQAIGDGIGDGAAQGGAEAPKVIQDLLEKFGWAAVGAGVGAALMAGVTGAMEQEAGNDLLAAQLGVNADQAAALGKAAGDLYAKGYTDSVEEANDALKGLWQQGLVPADATSKEIEGIGGRLTQVAAILGEDVGPTSVAVGQMIKTGMAKNANDAFDILVKGSQLGANKAEDLLDTFNEYPVAFKNLGLDGKAAMGLIRQGLQGGARDSDQVADALKEFSLVAGQGGTAVEQVFDSIGLSGKQITKDVAAGGDSAKQALGKVLTALEAMPASTKRASAVQQLFGGPGEDLGAALFSLNVDKAASSLGKVGGAAKKAGDTMRDNASTELTEFTRSLKQGLVTVLGGAVVPALVTAGGWLDNFGQAMASAAGFVSEHGTAFSVVAGIITAVMLPTLITLGTTAATTTAEVVGGWIAQGTAAATGAAETIAANVAIIAGWVAQGAAAVAQGARVVATWVLMGAQSLIQGARMAAAWLLAMGPIPLIIAAVVALVALIVANWDTISSKTTEVWNWVWSKIKAIGQFILDFFTKWTIVGIVISHWDEIWSKTKSVWNSIVNWVEGLPGKILGFFQKWTIVGVIVSHWDQIKTGTIRKASDLLAWVRGLPGRITSALGSLNNLLYNKGTDIVRGLLNGIKSMGGWLRGKVMSFARDMIPGPVAKALGIGSPSKVMAREVGRWIPAGVVKGVLAGKGQLDKVMSNLVSTPSVPAFGPMPGQAGFAMAGGGGATVQIEHWHAAENGSPEDNARELAWLAKARG
ncbi:phage tail tape measure protein [Streptomyces montanisoli]|uniref:Phage tail tape measure protein n=1 Tax=Streptomyces montanisoli TaxID=2798581 RepID=A0A940M528_9ACTN|nr:phage tail tape measure protein [Streptomyces montanisoli]MBP0456254.1 phage tail tape measure protein [Streptomyces montanisoli]